MIPVATEANLPSFGAPPVVETVLSVRFRESAGLTTARIVRFWEEALATEFPEVSEQPPYPAPIEQLGQDVAVGGFPLQLDAGFPSPRFWFTGGDRLVQLQQDWLAYNWRQVDGGTEYVRYSNTRRGFSDLISKLSSYVEGHGGKLEPVQCEVTYVNHIVLDDDDLAVGPLGVVLVDATPASRGSLPTPEAARYAATYSIRGSAGVPVGRLHASAESARLGSDRTPAVVLNLTARGRPTGAGLDGVLEFCDLGRAWIVGGFRDMTTATMHDRWKLEGREA